MSYFITRSNFIRITKQIELTPEQLLRPIYKSQIHFLNKLEIKLILSVKQVLDDLEKAIIILNKSGELVDTFTYLNEYTHYPKYHSDKNCTALNSSFKDIEIPVEIKYKAGQSEIDYERVNEFRDWMKQSEIYELYYKDSKKFYDKMEIKFRLSNPLRNEEIIGKAPEKIITLSIQELENKIDHIISTSMDYCQANIDRAKVLIGENLRLHTYWATSEKYRQKEISPNNTGLSDSVVRKILLEYHNEIKAPLIRSLIDYYIVSLNEGLYFTKNIMEQLEFQPCSKCVH